MKRRCYQCKCLEEESTAQFFKRTKQDLMAKFFCRKCRRAVKRQQKNINPEIQKQIINFTIACSEAVKESIEEDRKKYRAFNATEVAKKGRKRYFNTDKGKYADCRNQYNQRLKRLKRSKAKNKHPHLSDEERIAIGRFYRKCPSGYEIDHIIPVSQGGQHIFSNLQYLSKDEHKKKTAAELSKKIKNEIQKTIHFTSGCGGVEEYQINPQKRNRVSKFNRLRRLIEK